MSIYDIASPRVSTLVENGQARQSKACVKGMKSMPDCRWQFLKLMGVRRQMLKKAAITNGKSSSAKECSRKPNTRRSNVDPNYPESPQTTSDSRTLDFNGMSLDHDPKSPPRLSNPINGYLNSFPETVQRGPRPLREEEEEGNVSNDQVHSSPSPLACSLASPVDHLLMESLLDDVPSWKRSLLSHCTWCFSFLYFLLPVVADAPRIQTILKTMTDPFFPPPPEKDSEHIAAEMLAIDGRHNGWRYIVLPMAHADELVMNAVLAVSAFHRHANQNKDGARYRLTSAADSEYPSRPPRVDTVPSPQVLYDTAIKGLRQRSNLAGSSDEVKQGILVAVLVLLVAAMVTGRDDYSTILGMLCSATNAFGGEHKLGVSSLGGFLVRQVRK